MYPRRIAQYPAQIPYCLLTGMPVRGYSVRMKNSEDVRDTRVIKMPSQRPSSDEKRGRMSELELFPFEGLVGPTNGRSLKWQLQPGNSDFEEVLFVRSREMLPVAVEILTDGSAEAQAKYHEYVRAGDICPSSTTFDAGADEVVRVAGASVVNLNCLPDEIDCFIFAESPLIVVYAKGLDLTPTRERVQQPSVAPKPVERPHHTPRYRMKI